MDSCFRRNDRSYALSFPRKRESTAEILLSPHSYLFSIAFSVGTVKSLATAIHFYSTRLFFACLVPSDRLN